MNDCHKLCFNTSVLGAIFITALVLIIVGGVYVNKSHPVVYCDLKYPAYPEKIQDIENVVNVWFKVYNQQKTKIIDPNYLIITNSTISRKLGIAGFHKNKTFMNLYENCNGQPTSYNDPPPLYNLFNFIKFQNGTWPIVIMVSVMTLLLSGGTIIFITCIPICEKCIKHYDEKHAHDYKKATNEMRGSWDDNIDVAEISMENVDDHKFDISSHGTELY